MTIQSPSSSSEFCQPDESTFLVGFNRVRRYGTTQSQSSPATPCSYTIYQVQPDDTLERIALKHNCSVSSLVRANKLWSPSALFMKQFIRIPIFNSQHPPQPNLRLSSQEKQCKNVPATTERVDKGLLLEWVAVDLWKHWVLLWCSDSLDDLLGTDDAGEIGVGHDWEWDRPSLLELRRVGNSGSVDGVELLECGLSPDDKTSKMSSWGELEKVKSFDVQDIDSWDVAESTSALSILTVDDNWSELLLVLTVAELSLSSAVSLRVVDLKSLS
ncbi:hypothetical protein GCK72_001212 [Caenorhabditis remanei]|uniref:LysM domain-containing protein n=1 Tax=Caenorhabditis remanei TaxID=31234 RepID=A0A6A5HP45_CAERE|nr:hypothetical protein GCK72_001212 [Caenorhabditis remanei]KAF1769395.1 hypothetical protein GCK72_001212 [Caenorhabditis remanei]